MELDLHRHGEAHEGLSEVASSQAHFRMAFLYEVCEEVYFPRFPEMVRVASLDHVHIAEALSSEFHIAEVLPSEFFPKSLLTKL